MFKLMVHIELEALLEATSVSFGMEVLFVCLLRSLNS